MQAELVIQKIRDAIVGTTYSGRTYIVGGFVRDKILGRKGEDIDIVVDMPEGGIKLAKYLHEINICSKPVIYRNFGTALIIVDGRKIELVMTRSENYRAENRKPVVQSASLIEDIQRRDFTVNTLLMDIVSGQVLDLSGYALSDIKSGIIRTTSDPDTTFKDDPLRMLRAVRFAGQLNFEIEENTKDAILQNCEALNFISWQRKRDELSNMLLQKNPEKALDYMINLKLMPFVIPELLPLIGMQQGEQHEHDVWQHTLKVITSTRPKLELRLAALLHDVGKPQTKVFNNSGIHFYGHEAESRRMALQILKRLNYSSALTNRISKVIFHHMRLKQAGAKSEIISDKAIRKLILQLGENLNLLLDLVHADNLNHAPDFRLPQQIPNLKKRIKKMAKDFSINNLPINGRDIIYHLKIDSGERVGKLLDEAKEIWLEYPQITKNEILSKLERRQKNGKQDQ
jgi:tRNA nucleotidyltransferase/poly(A) polymerase